MKYKIKNTRFHFHVKVGDSRFHEELGNVLHKNNAILLTNDKTFEILKFRTFEIYIYKKIIIQQGVTVFLYGFPWYVEEVYYDFDCCEMFYSLT